MTWASMERAYSEQFLDVRATTTKTSGSGSRVDQKNASIEGSRTSLGRRYGSGVGRRVSKLKNLAKLACKAAQTAPLAARIVARVQGHISVLAQPRTRTRGKPHLL